MTTVIYRLIISLVIHRITIPVGQQLTYSKSTEPLDSLRLEKIMSWLLQSYILEECPLVWWNKNDTV